MHFQEGMFYSLLLKLNSLGLSTLKNCMTMIQILLLNILHVYILLKMGSFGIMTICSKKKRLCVPKGSIRRFLVKEAHAEGLMGHFGVQKTLNMLQEHFYWPHMKHDVHKLCEHCISFVNSALFVSTQSLRSCLMDFILLFLFLNILGLIYLWILF